MSVFYAVKNDVDVVITTKEVKSNVIQVLEDGTVQSFDDLADHLAIADFTVCEPGDKYDSENDVYLKAGVDAQGARRWYDESTGVLMQNTYNEDGNVSGSEAV